MEIKKGDKIDWIGRFTKKRFSCIVKQVKRTDKICKVVPDKTRINAMPYEYYWIDFDEILLPL